MPPTSAAPSGPALHDTHCHVDLYPDPAAIVRGAERARVYTVAVTTTPSVFGHLERLVAGCRYVRPAIGLHPELAVERHAELPLFHAALARTRYVGEVGLDYVNPREADHALQRRVLGEIIAACDAAGDKIVTAHSRRAADDVVDAFGPAFRGVLILHWYSGSARALQRALANGAYVSVNPAMLASERGRRIVAAVPRDRVLLESDGPFVALDGVRDGPPTRPEDAAGTAKTLAAAWDVSLASAVADLAANFRRVVTLSTEPRVGPEDR
jgi:TatD DNase family protein